MPPKTKDLAEKVAALKGKEAEDKVLEYLKKMNRPYGAVDVCANLKGAIPKATTQKILMALAEKGVVTQKTYSKSTFFVVKQAGLEQMPPEKLAALEAQHKAVEEEIKTLTAEVKNTSSELTKLKGTPTNDKLHSQIEETNAKVDIALTHLGPLRSGTPLISAAELAHIDTDWAKWRAEWIARKKIFNNLWHLATDSLPPQDSADLAEELGIEYDTTEHSNLERGPLCSILGKKR